jgi:hypothetical protein
MDDIEAPDRGRANAEGLPAARRGTGWLRELALRASAGGRRTDHPLGDGIATVTSPGSDNR